MLLMIAGPMIRGLMCVTRRPNARGIGDADADEGGSCMSVLEPDVDRRLMKRVKDRIGRVALGAGLIAATTTFVAQIGTAQSNALLHGNHPTEASSLTSHAAADLPLKIRVSFALRNRAALNKLLSEVQNPASPNYHKWLTPAEFDAQSDSLGHGVTGGKRIRDDDRGFERRSDLRQPERPANSGAAHRCDRLDRRARQHAPFAAAYRQAVQSTSSAGANGAARRGQRNAETSEGDDAGIARTGGSCA